LKEGDHSDRIGVTKAGRAVASSLICRTSNSPIVPCEIAAYRSYDG